MLVTLLPKLIVGLGVVSFVARGTTRLRESSLFAEDGQIFLAEAHNDGLSAVLEPYAGYLHLIPRLIAAAFEPAPITATPVLYAAGAIAVHLALLTPALSPRLGWLIPTPLLRALLFAALCVMPPMWEPFGNIANLIFVAGICLLLLGLSEDPRTTSGRIAELLVIALLGMSGPLIVIFVPFMAWRWWRNGRTLHSLRVAAVAGVTAACQLSVYLTSDRSTPGGGTPTLLARTAYERVGGSWLVGDENLFVDNPNPALAVISATWLILVITLSLYVICRTAAALWALFFALLWSSVNAYGPAMVASSLHFQRHIMIPVAITVVLLFAVIGNARHRIVKILGSVCLIVGVGGIIHDFTPSAYPFRPDLTQLQECAENDRSVCEQSIFDGTWTIVLVK